MEKNKKIVLVVGVLIIIAVLFFVIKNVSFAPTAEIPKDGNSPTGDTNLPTIQINPDVPGQTLPLSNDPKDAAWAVFQKYLGYNKDRNLEGVKSIVYKIAPVCEDPKTKIDCEARMGLAQQYGSTLKKEDFVNVWSDKKQTILSTNFKIEEDDSAIGRTRSIIFFVRDEVGLPAQAGLKLLSFSLFKGATVSKDTTASRQELDDRLITYTEDKDQDGMADYDEQCLGIPEGQACTKTDPKLRDTNGNGLWDGAEALMN